MQPRARDATLENDTPGAPRAATSPPGAGNCGASPGCPSEVPVNFNPASCGVVKRWLRDSDLIQIEESQRNFELLDEFDFRSPGRQLLAGPAPEARPQPARVAEQMRQALAFQETMKENGWSLRKTAWRLHMTPPRASQLLKLTQLAPDIQQQLLEMTTTTASCPVTERKLRAFVVVERDLDRQRQLFAKVLAGELHLPPRKATTPRRPLVADTPAL